MHPKVALSEGFGLWLDERTGGAARPMDPFVTSLRNTYRALPWLRAVRQSLDIPLQTDRSRDQAVTDMKSMAGLVSGSRGQGNVALTQIGSLVLEAWESAGALGESDEHEIARCILMTRLVMQHGGAADRDRYRILYRNWLALRTVQPAEYWWDDLRRMMLPCYLDWADSRGYNPFKTLLAATGGTFAAGEEWVEWEKSETAAGRDGLKRLLSAVNTHRLGGSRNFRRALEVICLSHTAPATLPSVLEEWSLPA